MILFRFTTRLFAIGLCVMLTQATLAQSPIWRMAQEVRLDQPSIEVANYQTFHLEADLLENILRQAPAGQGQDAKRSAAILDLPMPDGSLEKFAIVRSAIMAPELAAKYPDIQVFLGLGLTSEGLNARFDWTPQGFHAMIFTPGETVYIDPYHPGEKSTVISYWRSDFFKSTSKPALNCLVGEEGASQKRSVMTATRPKKDVQVMGADGLSVRSEVRPAVRQGAANGGTLRSYRLALAATGEYTTFHGGTVSNALSSMITTMHRVNGIFERDACLTMTLIANNNLIVYTNGATDPYTNNDGVQMLYENQANLDNVIGSANYDVGHVFSTGGGGIAQLYSPCNSGSKARGVTGSGSPVGDPFDVDYVAHEIGHQFGANHTQSNNCQWNTSTAFEPGSASTIMGYAGICPPNVQSNSDDHFHNHSVNEIIDFISSSTCAIQTATGNEVPTVDAGWDGVTIPVSTPFELTAEASDPDGGTLTYNWEQYDAATATWAPMPSANYPLFRSYPSTTSPTRVFPRMEDVLANTSSMWEMLPTESRSLSFKCSVRDNALGGGGFSDDLKYLEVTSQAGPFLVSAPNGGEELEAASTYTVLWDVANTDVAPVSCSAVDIVMSSDGGMTFPHELAMGTPNDGAQTVVLPNVVSTQVRLKIKASDNVFFDLSDAHLTLVESEPTNQHDAALVAVGGVPSTTCGAPLAPVATVKNVGVSVLQTFDVSASVGGQATFSVSWEGSLASGESVDVALCASEACISLDEGVVDLTFEVALVGALDENPNNNIFDLAVTSEQDADGDGICDSADTCLGVVDNCGVCNGGDFTSVSLTLVVLTDEYPEETSWELTDEAGNVVWNGGGYTSATTTYEEFICLPAGCYNLTVFDQYGDGMCCEYGTGAFTLFAGGEVLATGGQFASSSSASFCLAPVEDCPEDLNGNAVIEVGDVLLLLAEFGCESGCTTDLTGDGFVAVDDILILLSAFGVSCQ